MISDLLLLFIAASLFLVVYLLILIAKFYHLKAGRNLSYKNYFGSQILLVLGMVFKMSFFPLIVSGWVALLFLTVGSFLLAVLAWNLYKSMMSVNY